MDTLQEKLVLGSLLVVLAVLSVWLQFAVVETDEEADIALEENDPDYYAENFVSTGMDSEGKMYELIADRMVHYPVGDRSLLDNPHIIQYDLNGTPRHIYADSGWLYNDNTTVLLTGNVRVIQSQTGVAGGASTSERMIIHLKERRG